MPSLAEIPVVLRLQADAINPDIPVVSLLRTAKLIAAKLDLADALVWIDHELDGYGEIPVDQLPKYRQLVGSPKAWNPYYGWQPIHSDDHEILKLISDAPIGQALGSLEEMARHADPSGNFVFPYSPAAKTTVMKMIGQTTDVQIVLGVGAVFNIIDAVRNLILNWSLELEKANILGEGMIFTSEEKSDAAPVTQQYFAHNIGVIGNVSEHAVVSNLQAKNIDLGEINDLVDQFFSAVGGLPAGVRAELVPIMTDVKEELNSPRPDESRLRGMLNSIRTICEGASGNLVAQGIMNGLNNLLS